MTLPAFLQLVAGGGSAVSGTTVTATAAAATTPGNLLIAVIATNGANSDDVTSIVDNSTESGTPNVWQYDRKFGQNQGGQTSCHVLSTKVTRKTNVSDVFTATVSATESRMSIIVCEYSGFINPIYLRRVSAGGTITTLSHGALVIPQQPSLVIWAIADNTGASAGQTLGSPTGGYTVRLGNNNSGGGSVQKEATILDQVVTSTASNISGGATDANTVGWVTTAHCYVEAFGFGTKQPRGRYQT